MINNIKTIKNTYINIKIILTQWHFLIQTFLTHIRLVFSGSVKGV